MQRITQALVASMAAVAALGVAYNAAADPVAVSAKIIHITGAARYSTDGNHWQIASVGTLLSAGMLVQTAENSKVDLLLGTSSSLAVLPVVTPPTGAVGLINSRERESEKANIVRLFPSTTLAIDKLTVDTIGDEAVQDTELDLRNGKISGNVKKISAASHYEVKLPNGVAGIRGTEYILDSTGQVDVLTGSVVIVYNTATGPVTKVVDAGSTGVRFDPATGQVTPLTPSELAADNGEVPIVAAGVPIIQLENVVPFIMSPNNNGGKAPTPKPATVHPDAVISH